MNRIISKLFLYPVIVVCIILITCSQVNKSNISQLNPIKFKLFDNIIYVPVIIEKTDTLSMIFDTGCSGMSVIEENVARKNKIEFLDSSYSAGAGENIAKSYYIGEISYNLIKCAFNNINTTTIDFSKSDFFWGIKKYGLIGGNIIEQKIWEIDYINNTIFNYNTDSFEYKGNGEEISVSLIGNSPFANVEVISGNDTINALFLFDTGVRFSAFSTNFSIENNLMKKSPKVVKTLLGYGIGGESHGYAGRVDALKIGSFVFKNPVMGFSTDKGGYYSNHNFGGIIGADFLSRFKVIFDYQGERIILEENKNFNDPFVYDKSGIVLRAEGSNLNEYFIHFIVKDSPAEISGLEPEDQIIRINDIHTSKYSFQEIKQIFKKDGELSLLILRDEIEVIKILKLKSLI